MSGPRAARAGFDQDDPLLSVEAARGRVLEAISGPLPAETLPIEVDGSAGTLVTGGLTRFRAPVKSPVTERRQAVRFGTVTPNLFSMRRSVEVWSRTPEYL